MNTTTRRHPRTLAEAFPDERAQWLEHPQDNGVHGLMRWSLAGLAVVACLMAFVHFYLGA